MNKIVALFVSLFLAYPTYAAGPVLWGPMGAQNIANGPVYDNSIPYIKQPTTNYIANQSGAIDTTGWGVSGSLTATRVTANLPRATTVGTGISLAAGSTNDYAQYCFTLDDNDKNTKLTWTWSQAPASYANGDFVAQVFSFTSANCSGTPTQLYIDQVSSGQDYSILNVNFPQELTFDVDSADHYGIRYVRKAGTSTLVVSNVIVGPGEVIPMPASGYLGELSGLTVSNNGSKNFTISNRAWRKDNLLILQFSMEGDSNASGSTATNEVTLNLPSGYTVDYNAAPAASGSSNTFAGSYTERGIANANAFSKSSEVGLFGNAIYFILGDGTGGNVTTNSLNIARLMSIRGLVQIPIAEWADSPSYVASARQAVVQTAATRFSTLTLNPNATHQNIPLTASTFNVGNGVWDSEGFKPNARGKYLLTISGFINSSGVQSGASRIVARVGQTYATATTVSRFATLSTVTSTAIPFSGSALVNVEDESHKIFFAFDTNQDYSTSSITLSGQTYASISRQTDEYGRPVVGFGYVTQESAGLMPANLSVLDNATATRMGLKSYSHGTSYNGGNSPTITSAQPGFAVTQSYFVPYQMQDGNWRLKFNFTCSYTAATITQLTITVAGIQNTDAHAIIFSAYNNLANVTNRGGFFNSTGIQLNYNSTSTSAAVAVSGDIPLTAKPTWAY
jgi:hypothetical protein